MARTFTVASLLLVSLVAAGVAGCGPAQRSAMEMEAAAAERSPFVGKQAPDFTLPDQDQKPVSLASLPPRMPAAAAAGCQGHRGRSCPWRRHPLDFVRRGAGGHETKRIPLVAHHRRSPVDPVVGTSARRKARVAAPRPRRPRVEMEVRTALPAVRRVRRALKGCGPS